jgi:hypothetical protein
MSTITRALAVGGLGVIAGLTLAGPAQAATTTSASGNSAQASSSWRYDSEDVQGYYRSYRACEWAGERGERRGDWDDYDCYRARGHRHGDWRRGWVLVADECDDNDGGWGRNHRRGWDD